MNMKELQIIVRGYHVVIPTKGTSRVTYFHSAKGDTINYGDKENAMVIKNHQMATVIRDLLKRELRRDDIFVCEYYA